MTTAWLAVRLYALQTDVQPPGGRGLGGGGGGGLGGGPGGGLGGGSFGLDASSHGTRTKISRRPQGREVKGPPLWQSPMPSDSHNEPTDMVPVLQMGTWDRDGSLESQCWTRLCTGQPGLWKPAVPQPHAESWQFTQRAPIDSIDCKHWPMESMQEYAEAAFVTARSSATHIARAMEV